MVHDHHPLIIFAARLFIAVLALMGIAVALLPTHTSFFYDYSGPYGQYNLILFLASLPIALGASCIWKSSWRTRIITFVVIFVALVLLVGSGSFASCMKNAFKYENKWRSAEQLYQEGGESIQRCVKKLVYPQMNDYQAGWLFFI